MEKQDWIILRLVVAIVKDGRIQNPDTIKSVLYLLKKYGMRQLDHSIALLKKEKAK